MLENLLNKRIENVSKIKNIKSDIEKACEIILKSIKNNGKVLFFGNGGSASDSNHLACELISKFKKKRASISAISLASNNSIITAISNDYSFKEVFKRQIEGLGNNGDIAFGISTSAKSESVIEALNFAKIKGLKTILLTGNNSLNFDYDLIIKAPCEQTEQIQELHIMIGHIICEIIEEKLFN